MNSSVISSRLVCAVLAISASCATSVVHADEQSRDFGKDHSTWLDSAVAASSKYATIGCAESRIASRKEATTASGSCVRFTGDERANADGNARWVVDLGVVEHNQRQFLVRWVQLEGGSRSYIVSSEPNESVSGFGNSYATVLSDWSRARNFGAGLTRQYRRAEATYYDKKCSVLVSKRSPKSSLSILTCGETIVPKADMKAVLKSFK